VNKQQPFLALRLNSSPSLKSNKNHLKSVKSPTGVKKMQNFSRKTLSKSAADHKLAKTSNHNINRSAFSQNLVKNLSYYQNSQRVAKNTQTKNIFRSVDIKNDAFFKSKNNAPTTIYQNNSKVNNDKKLAPKNDR